MNHRILNHERYLKKIFFNSALMICVFLSFIFTPFSICFAESNELLKSKKNVTSSNQQSVSNTSIQPNIKEDGTEQSGGEGQESDLKMESIKNYLSPFVYDSSLRNPFMHPSFIQPLKPGLIYGPFLPLQNFQLKELKVKGLFWNTSQPKAIIEAPNGKMYNVGLKSYLGENFGYLAAIREREIVVIQTIENKGKKYTLKKVLFLSEKK